MRESAPMAVAEKADPVRGATVAAPNAIAGCAETPPSPIEPAGNGVDLRALVGHRFSLPANATLEMVQQFFSTHEPLPRLYRRFIP